MSKFIEPQDLVVPYEATDLFSAERVTHVLRMSKNEIRKQQLAGFYADIELAGGGISFDRDDIEEQIDKIEGQTPGYSEDRDRTVYEVHTILRTLSRSTTSLRKFCLCGEITRNKIL